jgi:hypothetical protein
LIRADLIKEEEKDRGINKSDNSRFVVLWRRGEMASRKRKKKENRTPSLLPSPGSCLDPSG